MFNEKMNEVTILHQQTVAKLTKEPLSNTLLKEYNNKFMQYNNMINSIEQMKGLSNDSGSIESLTKQQLSILDKWIAHEKAFYTMQE